MTPKRHLITTALPYVNGPIHIGHLAGVYIPADVYARFLRKQDKEVVLIGGSDEHGIPITLKAKKEKISPQELVNKYHAQIKKSFEDFGISFDNYSRTSNEIHKKTAQDFFTKLHDKGVFSLEESDQFYDEEAKEFLADRYIVGTCPKCENENAYGDQCEKCGSSLSPRELINPKSALSGNQPVLRKTKHWYLPLDKYQDWLGDWILKGHKNDWKSNVYGQVKSWLDGGLQPRAITRDLDWGVPVPLDEAKGKVLYVWFDAPIGYISSTIEWAEKNNKNWEDYWKNEETELIHFIGKDNIVFHCIIFPVMLKENDGYILPKNVPANEFMNLEDEKISTSRNWAVWLHEYLEDFPDMQDVLRYTLIANMPESKDNNFTWKDFQLKNNSELVGILGNYVNRVAVLTHKYFDGKVPAANGFTQEDQDILAGIDIHKDKITKSLEEFKFRDALNAFMNLARMGNKYLADQEPWKLIKQDEKRVATILHVALQQTAAISLLAEPFLPNTSKKMQDLLQLNLKSWSQLRSNLLTVGNDISNPQLLFDKIEDEAIEKQLIKLNQSKTAMSLEEHNNTNSSAIQEASFEDFLKLDFKVGRVLEAELVPKTDKLLKLIVDLGEAENRTIVSGIAESYSPEEMINKEVMVLTNLKPRKIKGIESQGMLLLAEKKDGKLSLMQPDQTMQAGASIG